MADEKEELGTEVIEETIDVVAAIVAKVLLAMADKKISVAEGFSLAFDIPKVIKSIKSMDEFIDEFKDIDAEEGSRLLAVIYEKYQELAKKEAE